MGRLFIVGAAIAAAVALSLTPAATTQAVQPINFTRGILAGAGFTTTNPSAMAIGPDGRLYVADTNGRIQALTLDPTTKAITSVQQVTTNADLQEVFGLTFDPSDGSSPPPVYVTNTVSGFGDAGQAPPGSFPGKVTKVSGAGYATRTDVITGLPISNSGHEANGLAFGPDGRLYIAQGSSTNAGVVNPNPGLFQLPDTPLSGAVLVADIHAPGFNGNVTYNPPNTYADTVDQAGGDVSVYAPGFRNPYGLVFHSNGGLYVTDNGPNAGYGPYSTSCSTDSGTDAAALDKLVLVRPGEYYGHANRNRGRHDARQCVYHFGSEASTADYTAPIEFPLPASSNGIAEYTSAAFGGQMQGDLLYAAWVDSELHRVKLSPDGQSVVSDTTLATGLTNALAVAVGGDGTIYVAEWGANRVSYFKPDESPVSSISVTSVSPSAGPVAGGQQITITGSNFTTAAETSADIGGAPLANLVVQNSTTITATTSASTAGTKNLTVTNSIGTAMLANAYTYVTGGGTQPPIANAGPDIVTPIAHENHAHVTLDGRGSTDPDGFIAAYNWSENGVTLSTNAVDSVQLTEGTHLITLTVTDNDNLTATDEVRVTVTATPLNPDPYYCFDVDGDTDVDLSDVMLVASAYGTRFGQAGYSRLRDWNADRVINAADVMGTFEDMTASCPLVDRQIRAATAAMEKYQNVNTAIADGYGQVTPYIPGQGRHMVKGGLAGLGSQDLVFDPAQPESLLYEPDASTPGGWRLGGAMYIVPYTLTTVPPDGFAGNDDAWHYHNNLCIWNNGNAVQEDVDQATCLSRSNAIWIEKAGWLLHLWNYHLNPTGRFVEINNMLTTGPAPSSATVGVDVDTIAPGVQSSRSVGSATFSVDVVAGGVADVAAFNFDLLYDPAVLAAPAITAVDSRDRNPDANQAMLESTGRAFTCTPPDPAPAVVAGTKRAARISCTSSGPVAGVDLSAAPQALARVTFSVLAGSAGTALQLANVNVFSSGAKTELASCSPTVSVTTTCSNATVATAAPVDSDGDGCVDGMEARFANLRPDDPWDFYSVPVPALIAALNPTGIVRDAVVGPTDAQAVFAYFKAGARAGSSPYADDRNGNGTADGIEYDRTVMGPGKSGPPDGSVAAADAQLAFAQFKLGYNCQ